MAGGTRTAASHAHNSIEVSPPAGGDGGDGKAPYPVGGRIVYRSISTARTDPVARAEPGEVWAGEMQTTAWGRSGEIRE